MTDYKMNHEVWATTRVRDLTEQQRRYLADRAAHAVAYLTRTGNADLIEMLGLDTAGQAPLDVRRLCAHPDCDVLFVPSRPSQKYHDRACGRFRPAPDSRPAAEPVSPR